MFLPQKSSVDFLNLKVDKNSPKSMKIFDINLQMSKK